MLVEMTLLDLIGMLAAFVLTVMVLLYAFDDNVLFRLAVYLFVGVAAGYASAVAVKDVILPRLFGLDGGQMIFVLVWIVLLAMKLSPRTARIGNPAAGVLVGVGAAVAIGGAIQGTLIPQVMAAWDIFSPALMSQSLASGTIWPDPGLSADGDRHPGRHSDHVSPLPFRREACPEPDPPAAKVY